MTRGIDISEYQSSKRMDYEALAKEVDFAILRIGFTGYGTGTDQFMDSEFLNHYNMCKKHGIPVGLYFIGVAMNKAIAKKEAEWVDNTIKRLKITVDYPVWYDTEATDGKKNGHQFLGNKQLTDVIETFCSTLQNKGYYTGIYASESWFTYKFDGLNRLKNFDRWVANWSSKPNIPHGMWQYSNKEKLKAYPVPVDMNLAYKDYFNIIKNNGLNGKKKTVENKPNEEKKKYIVFKETTEPEKYKDFSKIEVQ